MIRAFVLVGAALSLLAPGPVDPPPDPPVGPPAGSVTVGMVSQNGSGCQVGQVWAHVFPNERLTVAYSGFWAMIGPGRVFPDFRKTCWLTLNVNAPPGYTYAVAEVRYPLGGWLAGGATGHLRAYFSVAGAPQTLTTHSVSGPVNDDHWTIPATVEPEALAWAPCDTPGPLAIMIDLRVLAGTSDPSTEESILALDYIDAPPVDYRLVWRAC